MIIGPSHALQRLALEIEMNGREVYLGDALMAPQYEQHGRSARGSARPEASTRHNGRPGTSTAGSTGTELESLGMRAENAGKALCWPSTGDRRGNRRILWGSGDGRAHCRRTGSTDSNPYRTQ